MQFELLLLVLLLLLDWPLYVLTLMAVQSCPTWLPATTHTPSSRSSVALPDTRKVWRPVFQSDSRRNRPSSDTSALPVALSCFRPTYHVTDGVGSPRTRTVKDVGSPWRMRIGEWRWEYRLPSRSPALSTVLRQMASMVGALSGNITGTPERRNDILWWRQLELRKVAKEELCEMVINLLNSKKYTTLLQLYVNVTYDLQIPIGSAFWTHCYITARC